MRRYTIKQLRAMNYQQAKRNQAERIALLEKAGLLTVYKWQTVYKTTAGFLRAKNKRFDKAVTNARNNVMERIQQLVNCKQTTCYAYNEAIADLKNIRDVMYRFDIDW